jgi:hypothetical protein
MEPLGLNAEVVNLISRTVATPVDGLECREFDLREARHVASDLGHAVQLGQ